MLVSALAIPAIAHPVSVTRALAYVERDKLTAEVQVFLEDLFLFHQLKTDSRDYLSTTEIARGIQLHRKFVAERFQILDDEGKAYVPREVELLDWVAPVDGVPLAELMSHQLTFSLRFDPLSEPPEFLTFVQKFSDEEAILPSEMTLLVQQEQQGVAEPVSLRPHTPHTVRLRWDAPTLEAMDGESRRELWLAKAKQETLGISDYSSVYSFLYIEPRQVRHEILVPLRTLAEVLELEHEDEAFLTSNEQARAIPRINEYFGDGVPIQIGGTQITPKLETCQFFGLEFKDFAQTPGQSKDVSLATGRVGVILSYSSPDIVRTVNMTWNRFSDSWWSVRVALIAGDKTEKKTLSRIGNRNQLSWSREKSPAEDPTFTTIAAALPSRRVSWLWGVGMLAAILVSVAMPMIYLRRSRWGVVIAVVSLVLWSSILRPMVIHRVWPQQAVSSSESQKIFLPLHRSIYDAMQYSSDEQIYDALEQSVAGEMLTEVYRQLHRNLTMKDQGGAVARVHEVLVNRADRQLLDGPPQAFQYRCQWEVTGTVEHWGHLHKRRQAHEAIFTVQAIDGFWKIVDWDLVDERLLETSVAVRE